MSSASSSATSTTDRACNRGADSSFARLELHTYAIACRILEHLHPGVAARLPPAPDRADDRPNRQQSDPPAADGPDRADPGTDSSPDARYRRHRLLPDDRPDPARHLTTFHR